LYGDAAHAFGRIECGWDRIAIRAFRGIPVLQVVRHEFAADPERSALGRKFQQAIFGIVRPQREMLQHPTLARRPKRQFSAIALIFL